jgi:hypothetical protein
VRSSQKIETHLDGVCGSSQRTKDRGLQEQWLKALLESMALPNISTPIRTGGGPIHFRYSMDNLPVVEEVYASNIILKVQRYILVYFEKLAPDSLSFV